MKPSDYASDLVVILKIFIYVRINDALSHLQANSRDKSRFPLR